MAERIQHTVIPLFGSDAGFRTFVDLLRQAGVSVTGPSSQVFEDVMRQLDDDALVGPYLKRMTSFRGGSRATLRLMHLYAPAVAVGLAGRAKTLPAAIREFENLSKAMAASRRMLTESEINALRMLVFNQITTPLYVQLIEREGPFSPEEQRALGMVFRNWGVFNSQDFRSALEQFNTFSGRKPNDLTWASMNWVLYQQLRIKGDNPLQWGHAPEFQNQLLFKAFGSLLHDFAFVTTAMSVEGKGIDPRLDSPVAAALEALTPYCAGGPLAMDDYLSPSATLRLDDMYPGGRIGMVPLRVRALTSIFNGWTQELTKDGRYWVPPQRVGSALAEPGIRSDVRMDGFHLTLDRVFEASGAEDHLKLNQVLAYLMNRRLDLMASYADVFTSGSIDVRRSQEVVNRCVQAGLIPPVPAAASRGKGVYQHGAFWGSFIARGQMDISPHILPDVVRCFGRLAYGYLLDRELEQVYRTVPPEDYLAVRRAIWAELEQISSESNLKDIRVEPVILSAAIRVALSNKFQGFGFAEAYCLAFRLGAGSTSDGFGDFSKAHYDAVTSRFLKPGVPSCGFLEGEAGVYSSVFAQWRRVLEESEENAVVKKARSAFAVPSSVYPPKPDGKSPALGTLLGKPEFWRTILDEPFLRRVFTGYQKGLITEFLAENPIPYGGAVAPLKTEFSKFVDNVAGPLMATGLKLKQDQVRLTPLSERNEAFLRVGARTLSPQLDLISMLEPETSGRTLPELFEGLLQLTESPIALQTHDRSEAHKTAYEKVFGEVVTTSAHLNLEQLKVRFEDCPPTPGVGNDKFLDWVRNMPMEDVGFYIQLSTEPGKGSSDVVEAFCGEFAVPPTKPQSLYRAHHALGLLREAIRTQKVQLPEELNRQVDYVRQRTKLFFSMVGDSSVPNQDLRMELANNYQVLGSQLAAAFPAEQLHEILRGAYERRVSAAMLRVSASRIGVDYGLQDVTRNSAQQVRNVALVIKLYEAFTGLSNGLSEHTIGSLNLDGRLTPFSPEETKMLIIESAKSQERVLGALEPSMA